MLAALVAAALAPAAPETGRVEDLHCMAGQWSTPLEYPAYGPRWAEELWTMPARGLMVGVGRTQEGFERYSFEYMRIEEVDGRVTLYAAPQGGASVAFELVLIGPSEPAFENRAHDYPQRISYRRDGDNLVATVSLADGTQARSWRYRPGPPRAR